MWEDVAVGLEQAGRHVINVDLRGHGGSDWPSDSRYGFDAYVEDLRAVLGQMRTRPVVVAAMHSGWIATAGNPVTGRSAAYGSDPSSIIRGRIPHETSNPLNRWLIAAYRPLLEAVLPKWGKRCGAECVKSWNDTVGKVVNLTATAN